MSRTATIERELSPEPRTGRLLCAGDVAVALDVSIRTVQRLADEGRLQRVRLGYRTTRYTLGSLEALIADGSENGTAPLDESEAAQDSGRPARHGSG